MTLVVLLVHLLNWYSSALHRRTETAWECINITNIGVEKNLKPLPVWHGLNCSFSLQRSKWVTVSSWKSPLSLFLSGNVNYLWEWFISQLWGVNSKGCWSVKYFLPVSLWNAFWGGETIRNTFDIYQNETPVAPWDEMTNRLSDVINSFPATFGIYDGFDAVLFSKIDFYVQTITNTLPNLLSRFCLLRKHTKCSCFWVLYGTPHCEVCLKTQAQNCQDLFRAVTRCNKNLVSRSNANAKTSTCRQCHGFSDSCRKRMHFEIVENCWLAGCREGKGDGKMGRVFLCTTLETNRMGLYKEDISKRQYQYLCWY